MQFGFSSKILLFSTNVRFSTKTLAYLAYKACKAYMAFKTYKAFMAFKRLRLNPFQKYRSVTSLSVDWPRTIRLVYASVSILSVCTIKLHLACSDIQWDRWQDLMFFFSLIVCRRGVYYRSSLYCWNCAMEYQGSFGLRVLPISNGSWICRFCCWRYIKPLQEDGMEVKRFRKISFVFYVNLMWQQKWSGQRDWILSNTISY